MKKTALIILSVLFLIACNRKISEFSPSANGVNFSKFIAVGNSLSAGYADGALCTSGQQNSIPNIIAKQLNYVGAGEFRQPLIATENGVGIEPTPTGFYFTTKRVLKVFADKDCAGKPTGTYSIRPDLADPNANQQQLQQQLFAPPTVTGPYNNLGVPGATIQSLFYNRLGDPTLDGHPFNPYFVRFATSPSTTVIHDAAVQQPTFFYLSIGNDDVLLPALSGSDAGITPADTFAKYYPLVVGSLMMSGKSPKGVVENIPDITTLPYFNTISKQLPYNGLILTKGQADSLNLLYGLLYQHPEIHFVEGQNPWVITTTTGQWKQMGPDDQFLLTLPTDSMKCFGMGVANPYTQKPFPIPGKYVLEKSEIDNIQTAINQYNITINAVATANNLAICDVNTQLKSFIPGMVFDGITLNTQFVSGGLFSTDGVHPNQRGYAVLANYLIQSINQKYGCMIPEADITSYRGLVFP